MADVLADELARRRAERIAAGGTAGPIGFAPPMPSGLDMIDLEGKLKAKLKADITADNPVQNPAVTELQAHQKLLDIDGVPLPRARPTPEGVVDPILALTDAALPQVHGLDPDKMSAERDLLYRTVGTDDPKQIGNVAALRAEQNLDVAGDLAKTVWSASPLTMAYNAGSSLLKEHSVGAAWDAMHDPIEQHLGEALHDVSNSPIIPAAIDRPTTVLPGNDPVTTETPIGYALRAASSIGQVPMTMADLAVHNPNVSAYLKLQTAPLEGVHTGLDLAADALAIPVTAAAQLGPAVNAAGAALDLNLGVPEIPAPHALVDDWFGGPSQGISASTGAMIDDAKPAIARAGAFVMGADPDAAGKAVGEKPIVSDAATEQVIGGPRWTGTWTGPIGKISGDFIAAFSQDVSSMRGTTLFTEAAITADAPKRVQDLARVADIVSSLAGWEGMVAHPVGATVRAAYGAKEAAALAPKGMGIPVGARGFYYELMQKGGAIDALDHVDAATRIKLAGNDVDFIDGLAPAERQQLQVAYTMRGEFLHHDLDTIAGAELDKPEYHGGIGEGGRVGGAPFRIVGAPIGREIAVGDVDQFPNDRRISGRMEYPIDEMGHRTDKLSQFDPAKFNDTPPEQELVDLKRERDDLLAAKRDADLSEIERLKREIERRKNPTAKPAKAEVQIEDTVPPAEPPVKAEVQIEDTVPPRRTNPTMAPEDIADIPVDGYEVPGVAPEPLRDLAETIAQQPVESRGVRTEPLSIDLQAAIRDAVERGIIQAGDAELILNHADDAMLKFLELLQKKHHAWASAQELGEQLAHKLAYNETVMAAQAKLIPAGADAALDPNRPKFGFRTRDVTRYYRDRLEAIAKGEDPEAIPKPTRRTKAQIDAGVPVGPADVRAEADPDAKGYLPSAMRKVAQDALGRFHTHFPPNPRTLMMDLFPDVRPVTAADAAMDMATHDEGGLAYHPGVRKLELDLPDVTGEKYVVVTRGQITSKLLSLEDALTRLATDRHPEGVVVAHGSWRRVAWWDLEGTMPRGNGLTGALRGTTDPVKGGVCTTGWSTSTHEGFYVADAIDEIVPLTDEEIGGQHQMVLIPGAEALHDLAKQILGRDLKSAKDIPLFDENASPREQTIGRAKERLADRLAEARRSVMRSRMGGSYVVHLGGDVFVTPLEADRILREVRADLTGAGVDLHAAFERVTEDSPINLTKPEAARFAVLYGATEAGKLDPFEPFGTKPLAPTETGRVQDGVDARRVSVHREADVGQYGQPTLEQQRKLIDGLVRRYADRLTWQDAALKDHAGFNALLQWAITKTEVPTAERLVRGQTDALDEYLDNSKKPFRSPGAQAALERGTARLKSIGQELHADLNKVRRATDTLPQAVGTVLGESIRPVAEKVRKLIEYEPSTVRDMEVMRREFLDKERAIMPSDLVTRMESPHVEIADAAVEEWYTRRRGDMLGMVEHALKSVAPEIGKVNGRIGEAIKAVGIHALYDEVFVHGELDGPVLKKALEEAHPGTAAHMTEPVQAGVTLAGRLRAQAALARAVDDLAAAGIGLRKGGDVARAVKAELFGHDSYINESGQRIQVVPNQAIHSEARAYMAQVGLRPRAYEDLRTMTGTDGTKYVLPQSFANELSRAASYGQESARAPTGLRSIPKVGPWLADAYQTWRAIVTAGPGGANLPHLVGNVYSIAENITATTGIGAARRAVTQVVFDPFTRSLSSRLGYYRSETPATIKAKEALGRMFGGKVEVEPTDGGAVPRSGSWTDINAKRIMRDKAGRIWTLDAVEREARKYGVDASSSRVELAQQIVDDLRRWDEPLWKQVVSLNDWRERLVELSNVLDVSVRTAVFVDKLREGHAVIDAAHAARDSLFDPTASSAIERKYIRLVFPFWTYFRNTQKAILGAMLEDPSRLAYIARIYAYNHARLFSGGTRRDLLTEDEEKSILLDLPPRPITVQGKGRLDFQGETIGAPTGSIVGGMVYAAKFMDFFTYAALAGPGLATGGRLGYNQRLSGLANDTAKMTSMPFLAAGDTLGFNPTNSQDVDMDSENVVPDYLLQMPMLGEFVQRTFAVGKRYLPPGIDTTSAAGWDERGPYRWVAGEDYVRADDGETETFSDEQGFKDAQYKWRLLFRSIGRPATSVANAAAIVAPSMRPSWESEAAAAARAMGAKVRLTPTENRLADEARKKRANVYKQYGVDLGNDASTVKPR